MVGIKIKKEKVPIILIIFSIILALVTFSLVPFSGGDNFTYFLLGRALAKGKGYIELWDPSHPLHTQYPPIFPILLIPAAFLNSYLLAKLIVFLCFIFLLFFSYLLFLELDYSNSKMISIVALAFLAFSPGLLEYSHWVLSDIPYLLFSVLSLLSWSKKRYNLALFFSIIGFFTRTAGISLLIAVIGFYILKSKIERKKTIIPLLALLFIPIWIIYGKVFGSQFQRSYFQQLISKDPYNPSMGNIGILNLIFRIGKNILRMFLKILPNIFFGEIKILLISLSISIILLSLLSFGVVSEKIFFKKTDEEKKSSFSTLNLINTYMFLYLLTVWSWPVIWTVDKRLYLPILPWLAFCLAKGSVRITRLFQKGIAKKFPFFITGLLVANCVFIALTSSNELWKNNMKWIKEKIPSGRAFYFKDYINIKNWALREKIQENSVFMVRKQTAFHYFTDFPTAPVPQTENPEELKNIIETKKVDYIVLSPLFKSYPIVVKGMNGLKEEYNWKLVYIEPDNKVFVFKCIKRK